MSPVISALDRLDHIADCQEVIGDLLIPETDLHVVNRDKLAGLLAFLAAEQRLARDKLVLALDQGKGVAIGSRS